ncbi:dioxygenase family protein [Methyloversatilis thermotolerans]|uniref:dioxygenase family protein n=1 Tax=Methyloversatilis thermotolerans TaxID=1346290 RepID=UPI0003801B7B|nr:hypothetical protein [Methyloversatilis thermotolerans]
MTNKIDAARRLLLRNGAATGALMMASPLVRAAAGDTSTVEVTEGPYFIDELLNRSDIRSSTSTGLVQDGLLMLLTITVSELDTDTGVVKPLTGAYVDIWHCNALGVYSDVSAAQQGTDATGQNFLRGYQVTDRQGKVKFRTIYPGWYLPRAPHIHAKVRQFSGTDTTLEFTTQFALDDELSNTIYTTLAPYTTKGATSYTNDIDQVFTGDNSCTSGALAGDSLHLKLTRAEKYVTGSFNILIDSAARCTSTETGSGGGGGTPPGGGDMPPGGGGTPPGQPPA